MSVTSSGRSSTSSTIRWTSGLLASIEWAMCFITVVLPALGGDTIRPRWPLPIGERRSTIRAVMFSFSPGISRWSRSSGNSGVRSSKRGRLRASSGSMPDTVSIRSRAGNFSVEPAGRQKPSMVVALAQGEPAGLADRDVDVLGRGQVPLAAEEAVALVTQVEQAPHRDELALVLLVLLAAALQVALGAAALAVAAPTAPVGPAVAQVVVAAALVLVAGCPGCSGCPGCCWLLPPWLFRPWLLVVLVVLVVPALALVVALAAALARSPRPWLPPPCWLRPPSSDVGRLVAGGGAGRSHRRSVRSSKSSSSSAGTSPAGSVVGRGRTTSVGRRRRRAGAAGAVVAGGRRDRRWWPAAAALRGPSAGPAARRPRRRGRRVPSASSARPTPVAFRMPSMMSAFLVRVVVFTDRACAIAWSSSRSLLSNTERSSCCSAVIGFLVSACPRWRVEGSHSQGNTGGGEVGSSGTAPGGNSPRRRARAGRGSSNQEVPPAGPNGPIAEAKVHPAYRVPGRTRQPPADSPPVGPAGPVRGRVRRARRRGRRRPPWAPRSG